MWPRGVLFFCLSFLILPLVTHKYRDHDLEDQNLEDQDLISRLRTSGVL